LPTVNFIFNTLASKREARQTLHAFQLSFQPRTFAATPMLTKVSLDFFAQLSKREARQHILSSGFGFPHNFRRARLPAQFVEIQNATFTGAKRGNF